MRERKKRSKGLTVSAPNDPRWISIIEIASYINLTPDRVRYICSLHKEIRPMMEKELWSNKSLEEEWSIREFVIYSQIKKTIEMMGIETSY